MTLIILFREENKSGKRQYYSSVSVFTAPLQFYEHQTELARNRVIVMGDQMSESQQQQKNADLADAADDAHHAKGKGDEEYDAAAEWEHAIRMAELEEAEAEAVANSPQPPHDGDHHHGRRSLRPSLVGMLGPTVTSHVHGHAGDDADAVAGNNIMMMNNSSSSSMTSRMLVQSLVERGRASRTSESNMQVLIGRTDVFPSAPHYFDRHSLRASAARGTGHRDGDDADGDGDDDDERSDGSGSRQRAGTAMDDSLGGDGNGNANGDVMSGRDGSGGIIMMDDLAQQSQGQSHLQPPPPPERSEQDLIDLFLEGMSEADKRIFSSLSSQSKSEMLSRLKQEEDVLSASASAGMMNNGMGMSMGMGMMNNGGPGSPSAAAARAAAAARRRSTAVLMKRMCDLVKTQEVTK